MDELARFNRERWEALAQANVEYSRPSLDLTAETASQMVDPWRIMSDVRGRDVLCLASGGGQQSAAFGLLGANLTLLDFSATQLERDREALAHYGLQARLVQGDMRDLSGFGDDSFDVVWHAYSIDFIPDVTPVFDEVARVLRPRGLYRLQWSNPFTKRLDYRDWNGEGYALKHIYAEGEAVFDDPHWDIDLPDGTRQRVEGPREFCHTLSTVVNGLVARHFLLLGIWEAGTVDPDAVPGSWGHFTAVAPPYLTVWASYRPDLSQSER